MKRTIVLIAKLRDGKMKETTRKWHNSVLEAHNAIMFESLVYPHNIITTTSAQWILEDKDGMEQEPIKGYFALKDVNGKKCRYFIEDDIYDKLPVRVEDNEAMLFKDSSKKKSVIIMPTAVTPFRIKAEQVYKNNHNFINDIAPFEHTRQDMWTLNKIIAIMGYIGKTFLGVCSESEFGKSSIHLILDSITKKNPVFQPRSVPGVLAQITHDGNMVFDESQETSNEVKRCMENFSLQVGGNSPIYINGAMKSKNTKPRYDVSQQSITFLYNVYNHYKEPEKQFFDYIWSNKKAMDSRFLKIKLEGVLLERFDKDFDIVKEAEDNKLFYMDIAKHLLWLKGLKLSNAYQRRYSKEGQLRLKGRHKIIFDEITWGIDLYCDTSEEYHKYFDLLESCITSYKQMLGEHPIITEEVVEE